MMTSSSATARIRNGPFALLRQAAQGPAHWPGKLQRFGDLLRRYARGDHRTGLEELYARGLIDVRPNGPQLFAGSVDMVRFWITPAAADYYEERGIHFGFHQVLRFLEEPASLGDPIGLFSSPDAIIGHLMQVVHANPRYDLDLLAMHDGVGELEQQLVLMLDGSHPRADSIGAIVEEPDYHLRLLEYVRAFRADPRSPPPLRSNIAGQFSELERTFGAMRPAMRFFAELPTTWAGALHHVATTTSFRPPMVVG